MIPGTCHSPRARVSILPMPKRLAQLELHFPAWMRRAAPASAPTKPARKPCSGQPDTEMTSWCKEKAQFFELPGTRSENLCFLEPTHAHHRRPGMVASPHDRAEPEAKRFLRRRNLAHAQTRIRPPTSLRTLWAEKNRATRSRVESCLRRAGNRRGKHLPLPPAERAKNEEKPLLYLPFLPRRCPPRPPDETRCRMLQLL